jgi:hypothetical protein
VYWPEVVLPLCLVADIRDWPCTGSHFCKRPNRSKRAKQPIELIYGGRFLDSAIPAIVTTWSEKELLDRASLEFISCLSLTNAEAHLSLTNSTKNSLKPLEPLTNNSDPNP